MAKPELAKQQPQKPMTPIEAIEELEFNVRRLSGTADQHEYLKSCAMIVRVELEAALIMRTAITKDSKPQEPAAPPPVNN